MTDELNKLTKEWKPIKPGTYKAGQQFQYLRSNTTPDKANFNELISELPRILAFSFKDNYSGWELNQQGTLTVKGDFVYYYKGGNEKHMLFKLPPGVYGIDNNTLKRKGNEEPFPNQAYVNLALDYQPTPHAIPNPYRFTKAIDADPLEDPNTLKMDGFNIHDWIWQHPNLFYLSESHPAEVTYNRLKTATPTAVFMGNNPKNTVISTKINRGVTYGHNEIDGSTSMVKVVDIQDFTTFDAKTSGYSDLPRYINFMGNHTRVENTLTPEHDNIRYFQLHQLPHYFGRLYFDSSQPVQSAYSVRFKQGRLTVKNTNDKGMRWMLNSTKVSGDIQPGHYIAAPIANSPTKQHLAVIEESYNQLNYVTGSETQDIPQQTYQGEGKIKGYNLVLGFKDYIQRENPHHFNRYRLAPTAPTTQADKVVNQVMTSMGAEHVKATHFLPLRNYAVHYGFYNCHEPGTRFQSHLINFPYVVDVYASPVGKQYEKHSQYRLKPLYSESKTVPVYNDMVFGGGNNQAQGFYPVLVDGYVKDAKGYYNVTTESSGPLAESLSLPMNYFDDRAKHYYRGRERPFYHHLIDNNLFNQPEHFEEGMTYAGYKGRRLKDVSTLPKEVSAMGNTFKLRTNNVIYPESIYPIECYGDRLYPDDEFIDHIPRLGYNQINLYFNSRLRKISNAYYSGINPTITYFETWVDGNNNSNSTKGLQALIPCNPMGQIGSSSSGGNPLIFDEHNRTDHVTYWKDTNEFERADVKDRGIVAILKSKQQVYDNNPKSFEPEIWHVANTRIGSSTRATDTNQSYWMVRGQKDENAFCNFYRIGKLDMVESHANEMRRGKRIFGYPIVGGAKHRLYRHAFLKRRSVPNDPGLTTIKYDDTLSRLGLPLKPHRLILPGFIPNPIPLCDLFTTNVDKIRWKTNGDKWLRPFVIDTLGEKIKILAPFEIESHGFTAVIKPNKSIRINNDENWIPLPLDLDALAGNGVGNEVYSYIDYSTTTRIDTTTFSETEDAKYQLAPAYYRQDNGQAINGSVEMTYNSLSYHVISANDVMLSTITKFNAVFNRWGWYSFATNECGIFFFSDPNQPNDLIVCYDDDLFANHQEIRIAKIQSQPDARGHFYTYLANGELTDYTPFKEFPLLKLRPTQQRVAVRYPNVLNQGDGSNGFIIEISPYWTLNDVDLLRGLKQNETGSDRYSYIFVSEGALNYYSSVIRTGRDENVVKSSEFRHFIRHNIVTQQDFENTGPTS